VLTDHRSASSHTIALARKMGVNLDIAALISTTLEAILYGFSLFMLGTTVQVLLEHGWRRRSQNRLMLVVSALLFIFSTMHMAIDFKRIEEGFITFRDSIGPIAYFSQPSQFTFVFKNAVYTAQTLTGDGILIYRCYVVWQSMWVVALPILGWCAVLATGVLSVYSCARVPISGEGSNIFAESVSHWITSFFSCTFATNFITTFLLAYKIWDVNRRTATVKQRSLMPVVRIVADAGAFYSMALSAALGCYAQQSNAQFITLDMITPIISITFYMVILRVSRASAQLRARAGQAASISHSSQNVSSHSRGQQYPMKPLEVRITKLTHRDADDPGSMDMVDDSPHKDPEGRGDVASSRFEV